MLITSNFQVMLLLALFYFFFYGNKGSCFICFLEYSTGAKKQPTLYMWMYGPLSAKNSASIQHSEQKATASRFCRKADAVDTIPPSGSHRRPRNKSEQYSRSRSRASVQVTEVSRPSILNLTEKQYAVEGWRWHGCQTPLQTP